MKKKQIAILSLLSAFITCSYAATPIDLQQQPVSVLKPLLMKKGLVSSGLNTVSSKVDFNETTHLRLQQTYAGLPVWGGDVAVHIPKGGQAALFSNSKTSMNGLIYQNLQNDLAAASPQVFDSNQKERALQHVITHYQKTSGHSHHITNNKIELMVYVDKKDIAHYAFLVSLFAKPTKGMPAKPTFVIDAATFDVYEEWNNIQTIENVTGGGFGGNGKLGKLSYDGFADHLPALTMERNGTTCYLNNADVVVKDVRQGDSIMQFACTNVDRGHGNIYWNADHDAVNGSFSPSNDALYAGHVIKNMYQKWFGIPVLTQNGNPMVLSMRVHEDMENAYWDGSQMTFGDGGSMFYPLVSLGVGAHEISHGFTEQHSSLFYFGQSGGLNESFSDMAAEAADFYSAGKNNWMIGSEITKGDGALRYMDEPTKDCNGGLPGIGCSISHVKDYHAFIDVHHSSGIFNKAFYLIATSPNWNTRKAFNIMVHANMHYWTKLSQFSGAACGVLKATTDYQYDIDTVKKAFAEVGINTARC